MLGYVESVKKSDVSPVLTADPCPLPASLESPAMTQAEDPRFRNARRAPARREPVAPEDGERLQKVLADAGIASRRDCELAIRAGRIRVNGRTVHELPCWVRPGKDLVEFDRKIVDTTRRAPHTRREYLYFIVNKPKGVISTARDPDGRPHVVGLVAARLPREKRVYPVGRLDADSTGLVLLTDDGDLAYHLTHPRFGIAKHYRVTVQGALGAEVLDSLRRGVFLADPRAIAATKSGHAGTPRGGGRRTAVDELRVLKTQKNRRAGDLSLLAITLHEGQNREIRRLLARVGLKVLKLERVSIGPIRLGGLKPGASRALTPAEVLALRQAVSGFGPHSDPSKDPAADRRGGQPRPGPGRGKRGR